MSDDILIRILTAYQKGGVEEAKRSLKELTAEAKTTQRATEDLSSSTKKSSNEHANATRALAGLNAASAAGRGSIMGLAQVMNLLGESAAAVAAKVTLVAGAFTAGWSLGTQIEKWTGLSKKFADLVSPLEKVASIQDKVKKQLGDLNAATLAAVTKEFDKLAASMTQNLAMLDAMNRAKNELMGAETQAQLAEIDSAVPPGPRRERAVLEKTRERERESIRLRRAQVDEKFHAAAVIFKAAEEAVVKAESAEGDALKNILLDRRADSGATPMQRTADRLRHEAAVKGTAEARKRWAETEKAFGKTFDETLYARKHLDIEERTSAAKYAAGDATIKRQQEDIRDKTRNEMLQISRNAIRATMEWQLEKYEKQEEGLKTEGMRWARMADFKSAAAGMYVETHSAIGAVKAMLEAITTEMRELREKIKNLPR
jgi:hypothetical protein